MSDIDKLKEKWNNNKEDYKSKEVGSGVHSFVKESENVISKNVMF